MRHFDVHWLMDGVARQMWRTALSGTWSGRGSGTYFEKCRAAHASTGTVLIFTRDVGMHTGGWWKNPEYERCYHLSLSFRDPVIGNLTPRDATLSERWVDTFFHEDKSFVWAEPPYSADGKSGEVWHYRVFCDPNWQPIVPRGEVYTREFTERGWKSFSELAWQEEATYAGS